MKEDFLAVGLEGGAGGQASDYLVVFLGLDKATGMSVGEANEEVGVVETALVGSAQADGPGLAGWVAVPPPHDVSEGGVLDEVDEGALGAVEGEGLVHDGERCLGAAYED